MSDAADLGPVPERIPVDADLVRRLVADQFPRWAGLPVRPVADGGWDNWTFHLGSDMSVRMPSAAAYALAVDKEHRWLPVLAARLPLPVPTPLAKGEPGAGYPFGWSVRSWLDGRPARREHIADPVRFAVALAGFLAALRDVDPTGGPGPGLHNWYRGGSLATYDGEVERALTTLDGHVDAGAVAEMWKTARVARWDGVPTWFHGDIAQGNLLVADGELTAVIDFGTCGVGDPACDLAIAWTLLTAEGRREFRERLTVDDAAWARGRGWALWKTLATRAYTLGRDDDDDEAATAQRVLDEISEEYAGA